MLSEEAIVNSFILRTEVFTAQGRPAISDINDVLMKRCSRNRNKRAIGRKVTRVAEMNRLNYTLLSDENDEVRKLFGVPSNMFGLIAGRVTYVADKSGRIVYIFNSQTKVQKHADEALKIILLLRKTGLATAG